MRHIMGGGTSRPCAKDRSERKSRDAEHARQKAIGAPRSARGRALWGLQGHLAGFPNGQSGRGLWHEPGAQRKTEDWGAVELYPQDVLLNPGYSDSPNRDDEMLLE